MERICGHFKVFLSRKLEKKDKEELEKDREKLKRRKVEMTWTNWLLGSFIYAVFIARHQPYRAAALIQYVDIVFCVLSQFRGTILGPVR